MSEGSKIEMPLPDGLTQLLGAIQQAGEDIPDALLEMMKDKILFMPVELTRRPDGAPEHITNALDMYTQALNDLVNTHTRLVTDTPDRMARIQHRYNNLAVSGFAVHEIAAFLMVAIDKLASDKVEAKRAVDDWETQANLDSLRKHAISRAVDETIVNGNKSE
jgi:hypothetical protein